MSARKEIRIIWASFSHLYFSVPRGTLFFAQATISSLVGPYFRSSWFKVPKFLDNYRRNTFVFLKVRFGNIKRFGIFWFWNMQIHKQSSYFFIILYNNIKYYILKQKSWQKNTGFMQPASIFLNIQLSNSRAWTEDFWYDTMIAILLLMNRDFTGDE